MRLSCSPWGACEYQARVSLWSYLSLPLWRPPDIAARTKHLHHDMRRSFACAADTSGLAVTTAGVTTVTNGRVDATFANGEDGDGATAPGSPAKIATSGAPADGNAADSAHGSAPSYCGKASPTSSCCASAQSCWAEPWTEPRARNF